MSIASKIPIIGTKGGYVYSSSKDAYHGPDPAIVSVQLQALQNMYKAIGPDGFSSKMFWILRKNPEKGEKDVLPAGSKMWNRRLVPFVHNRIQLDLDANLKQRNICLKPRQGGYTTFFIIMRLLLPCILEPGAGGLLISQNHTYATLHFAILQRAVRYFGVKDPYDRTKNVIADDLRQHLLHTKATNRREIVFDQLESRIVIDSAEVEEAGQGLCASPMNWFFTADHRLIRYGKLQVDDWVTGPNGEKVKVSHKYIIPAQNHPYKGEGRKVIIRGLSCLPMTVAPNHPFLTQRGMVEAKDLRPGSDHVLYPKRRLTGELTSIRLAATKGYEDRTAVTGIQDLDRDFGFLCGMYLADGTAVGDRCTSIKMAAERKIQTALPRILSKGSVLSASCKYQKHKRNVVINSAPLRHWLDENFGRAKSKHVPDWWSKAPEPFLLGLLEGWICGDGSVYRRSAAAGGRLPAIVLAMKEITIALGFGAPYLRIRKIKKGPVTICGIKTRSNYNKSLGLTFYGSVFENLAKALNWKVAKVDKRYRKLSQYQDGRYVYLKIDKVTKAYCKEWHDITVTNKSHLYCMPYAITHNTINHAVCTEVARWPRNPEETMANMKEAIPTDGTLDLESTANGMGGYFYDECMRARRWVEGFDTEFKYFFHQWWWHDEYRLDHPVEEDSVSDEERSLIDAYKLDLNQIAWRRKKYISLRHNFDEKYPEDDVSCFLVSGNSYFEKEILKLRYKELESYKPLESYKKLKIFKKRTKGKRYVIGADVATGKSAAEGSNDLDWSTAVALDLETGEEMAAYRAQLTEEEFAWELAELGKLYNNAIIAVERTGYGGTTIMTLEVMCQYTNLYKHREWWKRDRSKVIEFLGLPTTVKTRPIALNRIRFQVHTAPETIHDITFVKEALTFIINDKGKPEAAPGAHDDTVMCRAIGHYCRQVLLGYLDPLAIPSEKYGADPTEFEGEAVDGQPNE